VRHLALIALLSLVCLPAPARAIVLAEDELEERSTEIGLLGRGFSFALTGPILRPPYALEDTTPLWLGLADLRLSFAHKSPWLKLVLHNQLTATGRSHVLQSPLALGRGAEPPRWLPLQWEIADEKKFTLRDSIDWIYIALTWGPMVTTAGRQPITFGRGKFFSPMDLLSTFALTEVDTEYKPGADALRLDWTAAQRTVITLLAVAGKSNDVLSLRGSSFALRAKQGWDSGEAGLLAGFIRRDAVVGLDGVWDVGAFDLYSEVTLTRVTGQSLSPRQPFTSRAVVRGLAGATFKPTAKLTLSPEIYVNGFGAWDKEDYYHLALSERVALGELSSLGRLYLTGLALWEVHALVNLSLGVIINPRDPSGLLFLGGSYNVLSNVDLLAGAYVPAGRLPNLRDPISLLPGVQVPRPRSEFGMYPNFVYLEIKAAM
jgi:hypothetical protein